jgi:hypothetical protein
MSASSPSRGGGVADLGATVGAASLRSTRRSRSSSRPPPTRESLRIDPAVRDLLTRRDELVARRVELLREQAHASSSMNTMLADPKDGLIWHAERTRRNTIAAIVVARQMGYFKYCT